MTPEEIEATIKEFHDVRRLNDRDSIMAYFTDDAEFSISGQESANSIACTANGCEAMTPIVEQLVSLWSWDDVEFRDIAVNGPTAFVHYTLTTTHQGNRTTMVTDVVDKITFADGKITKMVQFIDTAYAGEVAQR